MRIIAAAIALLLTSGAAWAEDMLKLAIGQRGNWENSVSELGRDAGFFARHGLKLEILYTEGGGQTQQAVISGSVDIGIGVGTYGVIGAFGKGAPIRIIGSSTIGARDLYWYVPANSPVKTMRDAAGKSVAYSTTGSSTDLVVRGLAKTLGIEVNGVATGSPAATFTQVMSGQVDVGWAAAPFGVEAAQAGRTRIIARGSDAPGFDTQTTRTIIVNAGTLARRPDVVARYIQAYREVLDWEYSNPDALVAYSKWSGIAPDLAKQVRDEFYPKENLLPDRVIGMEAVMRDAVAFKFLPAPLSAEQLARLIQLPKAP